MPDRTGHGSGRPCHVREPSVVKQQLPRRSARDRQDEVGASRIDPVRTDVPVPPVIISAARPHANPPAAADLPPNASWNPHVALSHVGSGGHHHGCARSGEAATSANANARSAWNRRGNGQREKAGRSLSHGDLRQPPVAAVPASGAPWRRVLFHPRVSSDLSCLFGSRPEMGLLARMELPHAYRLRHGKQTARRAVSVRIGGNHDILTTYWVCRTGRVGTATLWS